MSAKDLIPFNRRTEDEQKEIAKKGGVKSGETRRRKRALKQIVRHFLDTETKREDLRGQLLANGFDDDTSNAAALVMQIANEAFSGNIRAAELLVRLSGEDPDQKRKDKELKLQQDLIRQQIIKLKNFNFGDDDDTQWIINYRPDNSTNQVWLDVAALQLEEYNGDIEALSKKWGSAINEYATRKVAEALILQKQKRMKEMGVE